MSQSPGMDLAMFQAAIDSARDAVLWIDADGLIVYVNERACGLFGYTRQELLALRAWDLDTGLSREGWPALWTETLHEGTSDRSPAFAGAGASAPMMVPRSQDREVGIARRISEASIR